MSRSDHYVRATLSACITTQSPLHIGNDASGDFGARVERVRAQNPAASTALRLEAAEFYAEDPRENTYSAVIRDHAGKPYIPASSLRGALRAAVADRVQRERLFGPETVADNATARAGIVRLSDAPLRLPADTSAKHTPYWDSHRATGIQHGIAIDPVTGAVKKHMLYRLEFVPAGSEFSLDVLLLDCNEHDLHALAQALGKLDGGALGNGIAQGYGRVTVASQGCKVLTAKKFDEWVLAPAAKLADCFVAHALAGSSDASAATNPRNDEIGFELITESPLLIHQPGCDRKLPRRDKPKETQDLVTYERDRLGQPRIPGTTLKGWTRARARRIFKTVHARLHELTAAASLNADGAVDEAIATLFGKVGRRSRLHFSDATAPRMKEAHLQTFIAVDRFTGGVLEGALFRVESVATATTFTSAVRLDLQALDDWQRGLLLWLLRDALEGDLAIGSGKGKGFGRLRLRLNAGSGETVETWAQCLQWLRQRCGKDTPARWAAALEKYVATMNHDGAKG